MKRPKPMTDHATLQMFGHIVIRDVATQMILVDRDNAINFEATSYVLALAVTDRPNGAIAQMLFGNGASSVSAIGGVSYLPPNVTGLNAQLYNQTYQVFVDDLSPLDTDPTDNFMRVNHVVGNTYSDIVVTCLLGYNEPSGQLPEDNSPDNNGTYVFDEIGLATYDPSTNVGIMLTHVIFHPVQKSLNRQIEVIYTLRIVMS
jgi:hypothetical protein